MRNKNTSNVRLYIMLKYKLLIRRLENRITKISEFPGSMTSAGGGTKSEFMEKYQKKKLELENQRKIEEENDRKARRKFHDEVQKNDRDQKSYEAKVRQDLKK